MKRVKVLSDEGKEVELVIYEDSERSMPAESPVALIQEWCMQEHDENNSFLCYPEDGQCSCGEYKHHVHCAHGRIIQTG